MNLNKSHIISTDEDPGLRIESFAVINLRGVSTNKTIKCCKHHPSKYQATAGRWRSLVIYRLGSGQIIKQAEDT